MEESLVLILYLCGVIGSLAIVTAFLSFVEFLITAFCEHMDNREESKEDESGQ